MGNQLSNLTDLTSLTPDIRALVRSTGTPMNQAQQDEFWQLYAKVAQPAIERSCRSFARALTDNAMCVEDMQAWVDDRVWKMVRRAAWPVFHDNPTPAAAAERVAEKAKLLARWAYVALSRQTWRRKAREAKLINGMSRSERLASVSSAPADFEKFEELGRDLDRVRSAISPRVRAQVAASWQETADRRRVALALDATTPADDALLDKAESGEIKANTLDQMRCRSRRDIRSILKPRSPHPGAAVIAMVLSATLALFTSAAPAFAGEQTGGRPGRPAVTQTAPAHDVARGEQTGGRPG
jgi:hypothetical protein